MSQKKPKLMDQKSVDRIKSSYSKKHNGKVKKGSFPARAESVVTTRKESGKK